MRGRNLRWYVAGAVAGLVCLAVALPAWAASGVVNGGFAQGLSGWHRVTVRTGTYASYGYPRITATGGLRCFPQWQGNGYASIDVPGNADGYIWQDISVPAGHKKLNLLMWGNLQPTQATISVGQYPGTVLFSGDAPTLQATVQTCSSSRPVWLSLDLSSYAGRTVQLTLEATSTGTDGTIVNFSDIGFGEAQPAGTASVVGGSSAQLPTGVVSGSLGGTPGGPRSTIASALVPIDHAFPLGWRTAVNVVLTIAAMLLITFPAQLFNRTLDENYDEIRDIARRRLGPLVALRRSLLRFQRSSDTLPVAVVVLLGAYLGGLNDPSFGFNGKSVETFVAVIISFCVGIATSSSVARLYRRVRHLDPSWRWHARPMGLGVALGCVLVSRAVGFEPGYLYGVIAGVSFTAVLAKSEQGHDVALGTLGTLTLAVVAWVVWTPIASTTAGTAHPVFALVILDTLFAGLFVSGVVGTVINLMPLRFLPGAALARWHKGAWTAVMAIALFLLVQVMLLPAAKGARHGNAPLVTTLVLFGLFGAGSVAFHRYFAQRQTRPAAAGPSPDVEEQETVLGATSRPEL